MRMHAIDHALEGLMQAMYMYVSLGRQNYDRLATNECWMR